MRYFVVILGIFGLEWKIKNYIEETKTEDTEEEKCKGMLLIRKHHNKGAFLNAGQSRRKAVAALSVLLTVFLTIFFVLTLGRAGKGLLKWGLTLLLGGAYSNTYDRLARKYVVDYVSFNVPFRLKNVIFNIGDFCIMIGALLSALAATEKL
jgi:signal peptidase II